MDFMITKKGDLVFDSPQKPSGFHLSFRLSEHEDFRLLFHIGPQKDFVSSSPFKMMFSIAEKGERMKVSTVSGDKMREQQIRLALTTERGELASRKDVGSRLYLFKHEDMFLDENLRKIESSVKEAIRGLSNDIDVRAVPEKGTGSFYAQTVGVYIYEKGTLIFKFQL